jgi:hypothetical protein
MKTPRQIAQDLLDQSVPELSERQRRSLQLKGIATLLLAPLVGLMCLGLAMKNGRFEAFAFAFAVFALMLGGSWCMLRLSRGKTHKPTDSSNEQPASRGN